MYCGNKNAFEEGNASTGRNRSIVIRGERITRKNRRYGLKPKCQVKVSDFSAAPPLLNNVQTMYILLQILVKKVEFERRSGDDFTDGDQKDRKNMCACVCMYVEE